MGEVTEAETTSLDTTVKMEEKGAEEGAGEGAGDVSTCTTMVDNEEEVSFPRYLHVH